MTVYIIILITTFTLFLIDQVKGWISAFKTESSDELVLKPLSEKFLKRRLIDSILLPLLILEIVIFLPMLGHIINPWLYSLFIIPLFFIYSIWAIIRNLFLVKYHVKNENGASIRVNDNPLSLTYINGERSIELTNTYVQEINVIQPIVLLPPSHLMGFANFILNDETSLKISLITLGDPLVLKQIFPNKVKKSRSWKPITS